MDITAYDLASRYAGMKEVSGSTANPQVLAMLRLDGNTWVTDDSTPWCSAFMNYIAWLLRLPRSKSLAARSWLTIGKLIPFSDASIGYDVVVLARSLGTPDHPEPGPEVLDAPGHVGFFAGFDASQVWLLGGNQSDMVSVTPFPRSRILGVRRLYP